jgi:hypothetical protein
MSLMLSASGLAASASEDMPGQAPTKACGASGAEADALNVSECLPELEMPIKNLGNKKDKRRI